MTSHVLASIRSRRRALGEPALIVAIWAMVSALLIVQHLPGLIAFGPTDPDSQMRLVEVRDYLAGQGWTDLHQYRLSPPDGVLMHWSRMIDWPLAAMIRLSAPHVGTDTAEILAISAWPLLLYLVFFFGITSVARKLVGRGGVVPAIAFAIFASPATGMFVPGHISHHNAQIALFSVLLALAVRIERGETIGLFAGVVAAIMLGIGLETLPLVAMIAAGLTFAWGLSPTANRAGLYGFGLFFAAVMMVQRAFAAAPADWMANPCDIASAPYIAAAVIGGFGIAGLTRLDPKSMPVRFAGIALLGLAAVAAAAAINPHCLKGPYAEIDPRIIPLWLDNVEEAQSFAQVATSAPWSLAGLYLAPFLALIPTSLAFAGANRPERFGWGLTLVLLMTALAVAMWEARGATFASVLVVPGMAYAVIELRRWLAAKGRIVLALGLIVIYTIPNQAAETLTANVLRQRLSSDKVPPTDLARPDGLKSCLSRLAFTRLAVEPPGTVLIESNLGPALLLNTPHATLAAPYHRNAKGLIDGFSALEGSPETAFAVISHRHVAYIAVCPDDPEVDLVMRRAPDGLLARLLGGDAPVWLQPIADTGPIKLWRVMQPTLAGIDDPIVTGTIAHQDIAAKALGLRGTLMPLSRP